MSESTANSLTIEAYVAPMRPFKGAPATARGDEPTWSPLSATLIVGEHDAVLVDTLVTNDQVDALADRIDTTGKHLVAVYITHGHADHWVGLSRLTERFPDIRGLATAEVLGRATLEKTDPGLSAYWHSIFEGEIPSDPLLPQLLDGDSIDLEGNTLQIVKVAQGDTQHSTVLWVPSIRAVVAGDVVYNKVHVMTAETDAATRDDWIASSDQVAALEPAIVIAGHKRVGAEDSPSTVQETQQYLRAFSAAAAEEIDAAAVVARMLQDESDRDNTRTLWHSARRHAETQRLTRPGLALFTMTTAADLLVPCSSVRQHASATNSLST